MRQLFFAIKLIAVMCAATLLFACGDNNDASQTPEQVHSQWITALKANDRTTLLNLAAEQDYKASFVDDAARRMQDYITNGYTATGVNGGPFQGVDVLQIDDQGQGRIGWSRWRFAELSICYATTMTASPAGWQVQNWGQRTTCPTG